jgi:glycine/D-amino acid oxidase-like deaminating enzyme
MATPEIPRELLAKLVGQILQDPGLPTNGPTVAAWQEPAHALAITQSQHLPQTVDFAIIGSGITGCSVAKTILESGLAQDKHVAVFEARSLTTGATSRNGGFLLSPAPSFFKRYADAFGIEAARKITLFCDLTLENILKVAKEESLENESQIREVTTVATFADEDGFAEICESLQMYEEAIPEAKGKYTILNKETAEKVAKLPKWALA